MLPAVEVKTHRTRRGAFVVVVPAVLLLLALAWLYGQRTAWLADQWRRELATSSDEQLLPRLRQAADLGEPGVTVLAEALCSSRQTLAEAAADVLDEELHRWAALPLAETIGRRVALAEALADRVDQAEPDGRTRAADVAERLLQWPADARVPAGRVTLACERVLRARPVTWASLSETRLSVSERRGHVTSPPISRAAVCPVGWWECAVATPRSPSAGGA